MIAGIIFDFDGLILETESPVFQSWREHFEEHNCELPFEVWADIIGKSEGTFNPYDYLEEQLGYQVDRESLAPDRRAREAELVEEQGILPGVEAYIADAKRLGLKLAVASSSTCEWVTNHLSRLSLLDHFDCIRGADDVERAKPDPALYLSALQCLGLKPDEGIALEDSPNGIEAAKRAGLFCVAVPNELTRNLRLDQADLVLDSLADLALEDLLQKINDVGS